ncbi:MAG: thioredoxin family protein [Deltaproteobacteria bacterium]
MTDFGALWDQALPYDAFVAASDLRHRGLWEGLHRLARIPDWALAAVPADAGRRLLVLAEDWCGDASNTVPVLARLADLASGLELRILRRDEHPDLMSRYLTNGSRSIPIVIALDRDFRELGHWGPRPAELQRWVVHERALGMPKGEIYPAVRRWYARDHGESTLKEVLAAARLVA